MESRRTYGNLDDRPRLDGDRFFRRLRSGKDAGHLEEGDLASAQNVRLDENVITVRKGTERKYAGGGAPKGAGRWANPNEATPTEKVAILLESQCLLYEATGNTFETVPYQAGQTVTQGELLLGLGSSYLFRGRGVSLPTTVGFTLGKYPLEYNGESVANGGIFKMPKASIVVQLRGPTLPQAMPFKLWAHADLAPIEERSKTFTFNAANQITGGGETGHNFVDGEVLKVTGTSSHDGLYSCKRIDQDTVSLEECILPAAPTDRNGGALVWSESATLPAADFGVMAGNRLAVRASNDNVVFSQINNFEFYADDGVGPASALRFNDGTADRIVGMFPFQDDAMIVFKERSIHLAQTLSTFASAPVEITRQLGLLARKSVAGAGGLIFFLSSGGVYAIDVGVKGGAKIGTHAAHLQLVDQPLSEDVADVMPTIDWFNAGNAVGVWHDNRYFLAFPHTGSSGLNKHVLVYNLEQNGWESVDTYPFGIRDFVRIPFAGRVRLFAVGTGGEVYLFEQRLGTDHYGTGVSASTSPVVANARTRAYDFDDLAEKRWLRATAAYETFSVTESNAYPDVAVTARFREPDEDLAVFSRSHSTLDAFAHRFPLRRRGQSVQLEISNGGQGRFQIRELRVEGSYAGRALSRKQ